MNYQTYTDLGFTKLKEEEFNSVISDAEMLLEEVTRHFYDPYFHSLKDDLNSDDAFLVYRATQYEKAIALQCEFEFESGLNSPVARADNDVKSISIGRTTIQSDGSGIAAVTYGNSGVVRSAISMLVNTGLIYRGVDCR
ncbi:hypothetical protein GBP13_08585 [Pediococcus acidilactici]|uniref:hypothetical protein n=1 Tax=Pediococcus acidilactici TaxID=1254 RepID=UPI001320F49C|nr:hypothetical protein [Pediococcus acidilactici]KAF0362537.1 hypothetical protein GBO50_08580 [Pediococcus acidilactici]KAF0368123.1 hypothetical protein GBO55_03130 [Pediococcus acidilactici]KAF0417241.1 hypothetical protein GBO80_08580 [Pediococcus acidilactici]KAF0420669.1 hypothetical protein GBO82_08575 [Pediococcus acidilactici]KAF0472810.1 hypothetical protein GBP08_08585 [Pediococcus acidilactici]